MPKLAPKPVRFIKRQEIEENIPLKASSLPPETKPKPALKKPSAAPQVPKVKHVVRIQPPEGYQYTDSDRSVLLCSEMFLFAVKCFETLLVK